MSPPSAPVFPYFPFVSSGFTGFPAAITKRALGSGMTASVSAGERPAEAGGAGACAAAPNPFSCDDTISPMVKSVSPSKTLEVRVGSRKPQSVAAADIDSPRLAVHVGFLDPPLHAQHRTWFDVRALHGGRKRRLFPIRSDSPSRVSRALRRGSIGRAPKYPSPSSQRKAAGALVDWLFDLFRCWPTTPPRHTRT